MSLHGFLIVRKFSFLLCQQNAYFVVNLTPQECLLWILKSSRDGKCTYQSMLLKFVASIAANRNARQTNSSLSLKGCWRRCFAFCRQLAMLLKYRRHCSWCLYWQRRRRIGNWGSRWRANIGGPVYLSQKLVPDRDTTETSNSATTMTVWG